MTDVVRASLTAADVWSDYLTVTAGSFNFSIWGTFVATVTVQRTFDNGTTWHDVDTFTSAGEWVGTDGEGAIYRAGIKSGEYTSGTAEIRMAN